MKTAKTTSLLLLFIFFTTTFQSCKDYFNDDFNRESSKSSNIQFEQDGVLKFLLERSTKTDNQGKVISIDDSLTIINISGFTINKLDFSMFFYNGDTYNNDNLLLTFISSENEDDFSLQANEEKKLFIDSTAQIIFNESYIKTYILKTGADADYKSGGLFDNSYKYYKYDTVGKEAVDYDTLVIETGIASSVAEYTGYLTTQSLINSKVNLLSGYIDPENNFMGQLLCDSVTTKSITGTNISMPSSGNEPTLNTFMLQSNTPSDTVYEIQFMNYKK